MPLMFVVGPMMKPECREYDVHQHMEIAYGLL